MLKQDKNWKDQIKILVEHGLLSWTTLHQREEKSKRLSENQLIPKQIFV